MPGAKGALDPTRLRNFLRPARSRYWSGGVLAQVGLALNWELAEASIAKWLPSRVGVTGRVLATDLDSRHLVEISRLANVEVRRHDIAAETLPGIEFGLVHARLVLEHLCGRDEVLCKVARVLKPVGWLLVESVDFCDPVSEPGAREHMRSQAARLSAFKASGVDVNYGRRLPRALREAGLMDDAVTASDVVSHSRHFALQ